MVVRPKVPGGGPSALLEAPDAEHSLGMSTSNGTNSNRIIVGIGGLGDKGATHPAVEWAISYAASIHGEVELVHVVDISWRSTPVPFAEEALLEAEELLRDLARRYAAGGGAPIHSTVLLGDPTQTLAEHAANTRMLVIGTRGTETFGDYLFNTRAVRIAGRSSVSVVVVPRRDDVSHGIVAGVDGSTFSVAPLAFAASEADRLGEPLTVVHSWHAPRPWGDGPIAWPSEPEEEERRILAEAVAGIANHYPDLDVTTKVIFDRPSQALFDASSGSRMLVVGSHGLHGFDKAWLGSTSADLILAMPTTVAVIRG